MKRKFFVITLFVFFPFLLLAQEEESVDYKPQMIGLLKSKWEYAFEDNTSRFSVRNLRLGIRGNMSKYIDYRAQVEYSSNSRGRDIYIIDAFVSANPLESLSILAGQFFVPFSDDHDASPALLAYANRPFLTSHVTTGASRRDIGLLAQYDIKGNVPISLITGILNGEGANNSVWQKSPAILGRLIYGTMDGFRTSVKYYTRKDSLDRRVVQYGVDLRYAKNRYMAKTELVVKDSIGVEKSRLWGGYLQGAYSFAINNSKALKYIEPNLRGDAMGYNIFDKGFDVSRITVGVNFGFVPKALDAEIRLNYEKLFFRGSKESNRNAIQYLGSFANNSDKRLSDKFTIELLVKF